MSEIHLFIAARGSNLTAVRSALDAGAEINWQNDDGFSALMVASMNGDREIVTLLLERGSNPDLVDNAGRNSLRLAGLNHHEVMVLLLQWGANPNLADRDGKTPLHLSARNGRLVFVALLLEWEADPNLADKEGVTPLFLAAQSGHRQVVAILLERGADPNLSDQGGRTAMDRARCNHHLNIVADIKWRRIKNFVTFLHTYGFSSPDWSIRANGQTVSAAENSGTGSIPTPADVGTMIGLAAGGVGTNNAGPTSKVLFNRDLCRIISSYIPR